MILMEQNKKPSGLLLNLQLDGPLIQSTFFALLESTLIALAELRASLATIVNLAAEPATCC